MNTPKLSITDLTIKYFPYVLYAGIAIVCVNHCFFQDMIQLSSRHASWYYDHRFSHFLLPNEIDSGHPPFNGMMLALLWSFFGRSLWVGHVFTAIWSVILIYQCQKLCENLFSKKIAAYVSLVVLLDATLLSQSSIVSPDIILMVSFFAALRAVLENKKVLLTFSILFLSLISVRGMMCTGAIFFFYAYHQYRILKIFTFGKIVKAILPFLPGVLLAFSFLAYHYYQLGWIGYHANMPWAECFEKIGSFKEFGKNVIVMIWRLIDFGRFIIWILFFYSIYYLYKNQKINKDCFSYQQVSVILLFVLLLLISSYSFLLYKMVNGHRYLLPHYALITLVVFILLEKFCSWKKIRIIAILSALVLLSGNCIKYPEKISTGWDSTLSHLPFYGLRDQMFEYIQENNIDWEDISAGFGLSGNQNYIDLSSPKNRIIKNKENLGQTSYFIYSNISNLSDESIEQIKNENSYALIKKFERGNVFIALYKFSLW
jgi:hypothetical protein